MQEEYNNKKDIRWKMEEESFKNSTKKDKDIRRKKNPYIRRIQEIHEKTVSQNETLRKDC